jgi:hypothetical protein
MIFINPDGFEAGDYFFTIAPDGVTQAFRVEGDGVPARTSNNEAITQIFAKQIAKRAQSKGGDDDDDA